MKEYEVTSKAVNIQKDMVIGLSPKQASLRVPLLKKLSKGLYKVVIPFQLKAGEIVKLDDPHKAWKKHFDCLEPDEEEVSESEGNQKASKTEADSKNSDKSKEEKPSSEEPEVEASPEDNLETLVQAMKDHKFKPDELLENGSPKVSVLKGLVDFDISADERDMAWDLAQE